MISLKRVLNCSFWENCIGCNLVRGLLDSDKTYYQNELFPVLGKGTFFRRFPLRCLKLHQNLPAIFWYSMDVRRNTKIMLSHKYPHKLSLVCGRFDSVRTYSSWELFLLFGKKGFRLPAWKPPFFILIRVFSTVFGTQRLRRVTLKIRLPATWANF